MAKKKTEKAVTTDEKLETLEKETKKELKENEVSESKDDEKTSGSESAPEESKQSETKEPESEKEPVKEEPKPDEDLSEEEVKKLSAKAQKRYRDLSKRPTWDQVDSKVSGLQEDIAKIRSTFFRKSLHADTMPKTEKSAAPADTGLPWDQKSPEEPRTLTQEEYESDIRNKVDSRMEVWERQQSLKQDIQYAEKKYPELDPKSDIYDEKLVKRVIDWFGTQARAKPELRLNNFVDELMGLRKQGVEEGRKNVTAKVAKQAAEQAVSPSGSTVRTKSGLEDAIKKVKTIEDLDALEDRV